MNVYRRKFISRLGLMHMIATNICVWLSVLIMETTHEIETNRESSHGIESGSNKTRAHYIQNGELKVVFKFEIEIGCR